MVVIPITGIARAFTNVCIAIANVCMYTTNDYKTHPEKHKRLVKRKLYMDVTIL
jgi:hypothetical protein